MKFFIHNSFDACDVIYTRPLIEALKKKYKNVEILLECRENMMYLWEDLGWQVFPYNGGLYSELVPTLNCPEDYFFFNSGIGIYNDLMTTYGSTYQTKALSFNKQIEKADSIISASVPADSANPRISLGCKQPDRIPNVNEKNGIFVENGNGPYNQNYFYLNEQLPGLALQYPQLTFYCAAPPPVKRQNVIDCSEFNVIELSKIGDQCKGFLLRGSTLTAATFTEKNRYKPRCIVGWNLPYKHWEHFEDNVEFAQDLHGVKKYLNLVIKKTGENAVAGLNSSHSNNFEGKQFSKPSGLFVNTQSANCSIHESGKMAFHALLSTSQYSLAYRELRPEEFHEIQGYDFYIFNYHHFTMSWLKKDMLNNLKGVKVALVLETSPNDPFVLCPRDWFDAYCPIDPTMRVDDPRVYPFPRPLEDVPEFFNYKEKSIPWIGSFGFATVGKGFELVVDAVNREFSEALIRINIPPGTFADGATHSLYRQNYAEYLTHLCQKVAKPGIVIQVSREFMDKKALIRWCGENTLNCFLYNRNQPGLAATTDQAIVSGRPLAISNNPTFRHIFPYLTPYPFKTLRESINSSKENVLKMRGDWNSENFSHQFENLLVNFSLLPGEGRESQNFKWKNSPKLNSPSLMKILILSHKEKQCGIHQYGLNIFKALSKSSTCKFSYQECSTPLDVVQAIEKCQPHAVIFNYYPATMPWLRKEIVKQLQIPTLGIMHEVTQSEADGATSEIFDYYLCPDPTLQENNPIVFPIPRVIPSYINYKSLPEKITIGSFGFGFGDKGFERLIETVQQEFDEATISLHLPFNDLVDIDGKAHALKTAQRCKERIFKPGIQLKITHEFLSNEKLLDTLASHTVNAFFYDTSKHRGISSVIDYALAVQRPLAINKCGMFRHIWTSNPAVCIEQSSLGEIIDQGIAPLVPFYNDWSEEKFLISVEGILKEIVTNKKDKEINVDWAKNSNGKTGSQIKANASQTKYEEQCMQSEMTRDSAFNTILDNSARLHYQPVIRELFQLVPSMMGRKIPEANVQQAFVLDAVRKFAAKYSKPRILCVGSFEDTAAAGLKELGFKMEEIDPAINCDLNEFFKRPTAIKESYDIIFSTSVLEHVQDDEKFMCQIAGLLAPGGVGILTCDFNDSFQNGDPLPQEDFRFYTQKDFKERLMPLLEGCSLVDRPSWNCPKPDFLYANCWYTFATLVFQKKL